MNERAERPRILNPFERFSEIVFGLIMVLSFTGALSVTEAGRGDVHAMLIGAIGCNFAWGIIDATFYLLGCITEQNRAAALLRQVQQSTNPENAQQLIAGALPAAVRHALQPADFERLRGHLQQLPPPAGRPRLTGEHWRGALGVFLLVFITTFPVVVPFFFVHDLHPALRISNGIAIAMLFGAGRMLGSYAGLRPVWTGLLMVVIGALLVALTIALGG